MASATAQKQQQTDQQQPAPPAQNRGALAVIAPPRLPYHESVHERFGYDKSAWKALCESVFPTAKTSGAIILALSYCKARKLDPFKKPVHIVPIWDAEKRAYTESVWPGIGEHRTTAFRTGNYIGMDEPQFGPDVTHTFKDRMQNKDKSWRDVSVTLTFPAWCRITVRREVNGKERVFPGPRVQWVEFYSRIGRSSIPSDRWQKAPVQMLEKCAEAGALRRAFPEELGEEFTAEEAGTFAVGGAKDITPDQPGVPADEPTRDQFRRQQATDVQEDDGAFEGEDQTDESAAATSTDAAAEASAAETQSTGPADQVAATDQRDYTIGNATTEHKVEIFEQMLTDAKSATEIDAIRAQNEALLKQWRSAKEGSSYAKALAAVEAATDAARKRVG